MKYTHNIKFRNDTILTLSPPQGVPVTTKRHLAVAAGTQATVMLKPYVRDVNGVPTEMADLCLPDGSEATGVRYADFRFVNG